MKIRKSFKQPTDENSRQDSAEKRDQFQGRGYHGNQGNMDIYSEDEGYFGSGSQFYSDLPEEKVDTEAIDKEFESRYTRLVRVARATLTPDQFRIFDLYFIKCTSQKKIGEVLNVSQPYIAKACSRILEILNEHEGEVL